MNEVKNEGLEVVGFECANGDVLCRGDMDRETFYTMASLQVPGIEKLCLQSEAIAGYAVRDARIATQEAQIKVLQSDANSWQSGYDEGRRMGGKHCKLTIDQLRAELAAATPIPDADHVEHVRAMVVPGGWMLVPVEPTEAMESAGFGANCHTNAAVYRAMLAASHAPGDSQ